MKSALGAVEGQVYFSPHGPPMTLDNVSQATARALPHWAIDRRVSDPLSHRWAEDFVIHDLSSASLPDRWCDGHVLKLQASRRDTFGRQAKRLVL
jgi:hypothetical protein